MTLINLVLRVWGPMRERSLTNTLLVLQVASCGLGLFVRYYLSGFLFEGGPGPGAAAAAGGGGGGGGGGEAMGAA